MHRTNGDSFGTGTSSHGVAGIHVYRDELAGSYDATQGRHQEMNALQEEIADVIEHESIALNTDSETPATMTQLRAALDARHVASRVTNDSLNVAGTYVSDALDNLADRITYLGSDDITNDSGVWGTSVSDALDELSDTDGIDNVSSMEGSTLSDSLDELNNQRKLFISGCAYTRHASFYTNIIFSDGYAMDTTGAYLLRMPGTTFIKQVINGSGWVAGSSQTGIPDGVTVAANTKLFIFLLRLPTGATDIGFDIDITAANLRADTDCLATHYRRIGFCMVYSMDTVNGQLYYCSQDGAGNHRVHRDSSLGANPYYEKTSGSSPTNYSADIYTPASGISCRFKYQVAQPAGTGGAATCYVCPSEVLTYESSVWTGWNLWHASSSATAPYHSNYIELPMSNGTLSCFADPYTDILIRFQILGWKDLRDPNF